MQGLAADIGFACQGSKAALSLSDKTQHIQKHIDIVVLLEFFQGEFDSVIGALGVAQVFQPHFIMRDVISFVERFHGF